MAAEVIRPGLIDRGAITREFAERYFARPLTNDFEKHFMNLDRQSWLRDESLMRSDRMTMAFGLEARVPILDYRLMELAYRLPTAWKFSVWQRPANFQGKQIWREAIADYIPPHIWGQRKRGWFTPMAKWIRTDVKPLVEDALLSSRLPVEYFNPAGVAAVWRDHLSGKRYNLNVIWAIFMWTLWHERFIQGRNV